MEDSDSAIQKTDSLGWFAKHPVIASVLWIMGTDLKNSPDSRSSLASDDAKSNNRLSWKDDYGGHIAEYVGQIQSQKSDGGIVKQRKDGSKQQSTLRKWQDTIDRSPPHGPQKKDVQNSKAKEFYDLENDAQSPQWGFYVSITPPQEQFSSQGSHQQSIAPGSLPVGPIAHLRR